MTTLLIALAMLTQDTEAKRQDEPAKPEAKAAIMKAFEATGALGGFEFKGDVEKPEDDAGGMAFHFGMDGGTFTGKYTGRVGKDGTVHVQAKNETATIDIYRKGDKLVKRQTWTGKALPADTFADEALSMINFAKLAELVKDAAEKDCRVSKETKVAGEDAIVVKVKMPTKMIQKRSSDDGMSFDMMELKDVQATFTIAKADSRLLRVKFGLEFGLSDSVKVGMGEDDEGGMEMKDEREYAFDVVKYDAEMKVELPEDVKGLLEK